MENLRKYIIEITYPHARNLADIQEIQVIILIEWPIKLIYQTNTTLMDY